MFKVSVFFTLLAIIIADEREFPKDFLFGVASSSYQVEGGWNENGKGENIWDRFTHTQPNKILDGSSGDIACDSYHKIKEDVAIIKNLGVHFYRFSLSWARILPTGFTNKINQDGLRYYNELIDELIKNNIKPMITLYHWDLPQPLQEIGGWPNPFLADYFADYARVAFENFGDRVKLWITINEPYHICQTGYQSGIFAPGYQTKGFGNYMCGYTVLLAHAKAYHMYDKEFRHKQKGKIGITIDTFWYEPKTNSTEDKHAAELTIQMNYGWFAHPIFSEKGDFPPLMKDIIDNKSKSENLQRSRLPELNKKEIEYIKGTADFLGLNHYSSFQVEALKSTSTPNLFASADIDSILEQPPDWEETPTFWIKITPWGLRKLLNWIKDQYHNPIVYIIENGVGDTQMVINDEIRVKYYKGYLNAVLDAMEDGCKVEAYTAWSLMDNFEWNSGYQLRFGLYQVDFNDTTRKRVAKSSVLYYKKVIETRRTDHEFQPVTENKIEL